MMLLVSAKFTIFMSTMYGFYLFSIRSKLILNTIGVYFKAIRSWFQTQFLLISRCRGAQQRRTDDSLTAARNSCRDTCAYTATRGAISPDARARTSVQRYKNLISICNVWIANFARRAAFLISLTKKDFKIHYLYAIIFVIKHIFRNFAAVLGKRGSLENPK